MDELEAEVERLSVAIEAVVPADDFPSASEAGGLGFWSLITGSERPDWADRVIAVLDLIDQRSGGRFAGLDVDARVAVLDGLVDDPDYRLVRSAGQRGVLRRPRQRRQRRCRLLADVGLESGASRWLAGGGCLGAGPQPNHPA